MENTFGNMLSYLRKRQGLSQSELAKKLHVSPATIGLYEQGRRQPRREIEEAIADYFNVSLTLLRGITTEIDREEDEIVQSYRKLNTADKETVKRLLAYMLTVEAAKNKEEV